MKTSSRQRYLFLLYLLATTSPASCTPGSSSLTGVIRGLARSGQMQSALTRSIPALNIYRGTKHDSRSSRTTEVAVKRKLKIPKLEGTPLDKKNLKNGGFYYGITPRTFQNAVKAEEKKPLSVRDSMQEALGELRYMRLEMEQMRKEMEQMKRKMIADGDMEDEDAGPKAAAGRRKREREFEKLAGEVERWALKILNEEGEEDGWQEVSCNKMMRNSLNSSGRTTAYLKWMKDSRGPLADKNDDTEYPCLKVFGTIDAPLEDVSTYLSQESATPEYNDVVVKYKDVDEITPHSKICWSQSPQILFLKPRDFVTFCHHRWRRDGTQVVINQACEHPDYPANKEEREGKACRAYALRGANFISRCPDNPEKTRITMVAHANPGGNVPQWAAKTAVNALVPIEPFKLFHKINEKVKQHRPELRERMAQTEMVSLPNGRSPRPAGLAQMGYACFWPNGGGLMEGAKEQSTPQDHSPDEHRTENRADTLLEAQGDGSES